MEDEPRECRICFSGETSDDELIAPCLCRGTQRYIHRSCLDRWRATSAEHFRQCSVCKFRYRIRTVPIDERKLRLRWMLLVARDVLIALVLLCGWLVFASMVLYPLGEALGLTDFFIDYGYGEEWDGHVSLAMRLAVSLLLTLALLGLYGLWTGRMRLPLMLHGSWMGGRVNMVCCGGLPVVFFLIVTGAFFAVLFGAQLVKERLAQHTEKLYRREETKKYRVIDLSDPNIEVFERPPRR